MTDTAWFKYLADERARRSQWTDPPIRAVAGIPVCDVQPGQIVTFGDRSRMLRTQFRWRRIWSVARDGDQVTLRSWWHRRRTVPAGTRVWLWQS